MRELLTKRDIQLTKSLGQNFLHDGNQLRRIVKAAELKPTDRVLEIGPGLGPLTELLLAEAGEVLAIEKDGRLVDFLRERFVSSLNQPQPPPPPESANNSPSPGGDLNRLGSGLRNLPEAKVRSGPSERERVSQRRGEGDRRDQLPTDDPIRKENAPRLPEATPTDSTPAFLGRLILRHDDALVHLQHGPHDWHDWKLVANLPYSVASPILVELAQSPQRPERMVTTLQLEVAQRLMAKADDDDYGILTLLVQLDYEPREWFKIPAGCFFPAPDVDSACVVLTRRAQPFLNEAQRPVFVRIVKRAFSQRRKMMLKLLKQEWPVDKLTAAFAELNISPMERAEKLSLHHFTALTRWLHP